MHDAHSTDKETQAHGTIATECLLCGTQILSCLNMFSYLILRAT